MAKAEKYRLQVMLTIRQRLKRKSEMELARAFKKLSEAKEKLKELEEELTNIIERWQAARKEMRAELNSGAAVGKSNVHVNFMRKLKDDELEKEEEIAEQKEAVEEAKEAMKQARRDYIDASQALQVMEKHKELWAKKVKGELSKREAKELDQLGQTVHKLRSWRGEKSVFGV